VTTDSAHEIRRRARVVAIGYLHHDPKVFLAGSPGRGVEELREGVEQFHGQER
jgi:hypothetical protein